MKRIMEAIPAAAEPGLLRRASAGWTSEALATWLECEHKVTVQSTIVAAYVKRHREFARMAAQIEACDHVGPDLKGIANMIERVIELRGQARREGLPHLETVALDLEMTIRMFRLHLAMEVGLRKPKDPKLLPARNAQNLRPTSNVLQFPRRRRRRVH